MLAADYAPVVVAIVVGGFGIVTPIVVARFVKKAAVATSEQINEIHILVDGRMTDAVNRIDQLTKALERSDTDVPAALPQMQHLHSDPPTPQSTPVTP